MECLTETEIFRELSFEIESFLIDLKSSLIELKNSLIQLESCLYIKYKRTDALSLWHQQ